MNARVRLSQVTNSNMARTFSFPIVIIAAEELPVPIWIAYYQQNIGNPLEDMGTDEDTIVITKLFQSSPSAFGQKEPPN